MLLGQHDVAVEVSDGRGGFDSQAFTLNVITNRAPEFTSTPPTAATVGQTFGYFAEAPDPDGDAVTFQLTQSPDGMSINPATGLVTWTPAPDQLGSSPVTIQASDELGAANTQSFTVNVTGQVPNQAPQITSTPLFDAVAERQYEYLVIAADPNGDLPRYQLLEAPQGMVIAQFGGLITWTPTEDQPDLEPVEDASFDRLHLVRPERAYFGRKDYQQLVLLRRMCRDLDLPVEVIGCPTEREATGLARSSRNRRLSAAGRTAASVLYQGLREARACFEAGERDSPAIIMAAGVRQT